MISRRMKTGLLATLLLGASVPLAAAQSQPPSIEDMTANDILKAMQIDGRVAMAGTFFESDSAKLTAEAETVLSKLAESLEQMPDARVAVVGHSDSTGDFAYNVDLSAMRAQNVIEALVSNHGVRRARLVGLGAGPIDPAASNATPEGRAQNRRVAFVVIDETEANPEQSGGASQSVSADQPATGVWMSDAVTGCAIWSAEEPGDSEKASWSGACDAGQASGRGTLLFWDEQGVIARYQGEMKGGRLDGSGFLAFREEDGTDYYTYSGKFRFG